jgi:hypothetical protein
MPDVDGYLPECPRCNDLRHSYDECENWTITRNDQYYLSELRDRKCLVRTRFDPRETPGFWVRPFRPHTPGFTAKLMAESYYKPVAFGEERRGDERLRDLAWHRDPKYIGDLIPCQFREGQSAISSSMRVSPALGAAVECCPSPPPSPSAPQLPTGDGPADHALPFSSQKLKFRTRGGIRHHKDRTVSIQQPSALGRSLKFYDQHRGRPRAASFNDSVHLQFAQNIRCSRDYQHLTALSKLQAVATARGLPTNRIQAVLVKNSTGGLIPPQLKVEPCPTPLTDLPIFPIAPPDPLAASSNKRKHSPTIQFAACEPHITLSSYGETIPPSPPGRQWPQFF